MKVLVVGSGGREHALAWAIARNAAAEIHAAPGNAGIEEVARCHNVEAEDLGGVAGLVEREGIELTVVGPEAPLVAGLADRLRDGGHRVFGPGAAGARLEGSKAWAKDLCRRHGIPTPRAEVFDDVDEAVAFLDTMEPPYVVKADGLAAGKGVAICATREDAVQALKERLVGRAFGEAGATVLVEEHLAGHEVSALALIDGETILPLMLAQDFKRARDGDEGPNTGGMGAYSPVPFVDEEAEIRALLEQTLEALRAEGIAYRGVIYAGLMLTDDGPRVLEYNCRFGDPETQAVVPRIGSDLLEVLTACAEGRLAEVELRARPEACVCVVAASGGYPGEYETGVEIRGVPESAVRDDVVVFHAGTTREDGRLLTAGGRVLAVSALGEDLAAARRHAYEALALISFDGMHHRTDIAKEAADG
ncbi:MAG TPA: phosphoribosylamine--glycine ligase [Actinomycetota bacterium]|nr:phosphoribosylamine--glycine ligase [Actinomycetota bacterium]